MNRERQNKKRHGPYGHAVFILIIPCSGWDGLRWKRRDSGSLDEPRQDRFGEALCRRLEASACNIGTSLRNFRPPPLPSPVSMTVIFSMFSHGLRRYSA